MSNDQDMIATTNPTLNQCAQVPLKEKQSKRWGALQKRYYRQDIVRAVSWDIESESEGGDVSTGRRRDIEKVQFTPSSTRQIQIRK